MILHLEVMSSSPTVGIEITYIHTYIHKLKKKNSVSPVKILISTTFTRLKNMPDRVVRTLTDLREVPCFNNDR